MDDFEQADSYDDAPAQPSLAGPLLLALFFAAVAFLIYGIVTGGFGGGDELAVDASDAPSASTVAVPTEDAPPLSELPSDEPSQTAIAPEPTTGAEGTGDPAATGAPGQIGAGTSVQVIAGAGTTAEQFDGAAAALGELGYDVTEAGSSPNEYAQTTVFPTAGEEATAQALVDGDPRFAVVGTNPGNLTDSLQIHVLVGEDWPA